jgi:hypothetical protein
MFNILTRGYLWAYFTCSSTRPTTSAQWVKRPLPLFRQTICCVQILWMPASIWPKIKFAWQFWDLSDFYLRRYDFILGQNSLILVKIGPNKKAHNFRKNEAMIMKLGQNNCFDRNFPKITWKYPCGRLFVFFLKPIVLLFTNNGKQYKNNGNNRNLNFLIRIEKYYYFMLTDQI